MSDNITIKQLRDSFKKDLSLSLQDTINDLQFEIESKSRRLQQIEKELKDIIEEDNQTNIVEANTPIIGSWFINYESSTLVSVYYVVSKGDIYTDLTDTSFKTFKLSIHGTATAYDLVYSITINSVIYSKDIASNKLQFISENDAKVFIKNNFTLFFEDVVKLIQGL